MPRVGVWWPRAELVAVVTVLLLLSGAAGNVQKQTENIGTSAEQRGFRSATAGRETAARSPGVSAETEGSGEGNFQEVELRNTETFESDSSSTAVKDPTVLMLEQRQDRRENNSDSLRDSVIFDNSRDHIEDELFAATVLPTSQTHKPFANSEIMPHKNSAASPSTSPDSGQALTSDKTIAPTLSSETISHLLIDEPLSSEKQGPGGAFPGSAPVMDVSGMLFSVPAPDLSRRSQPTASPAETTPLLPGFTAPYGFVAEFEPRTLISFEDVPRASTLPTDAPEAASNIEREINEEVKTAKLPDGDVSDLITPTPTDDFNSPIPINREEPTVSEEGLTQTPHTTSLWEPMPSFSTTTLPVLRKNSRRSDPAIHTVLNNILSIIGGDARVSVDAADSGSTSSSGSSPGSGSESSSGSGPGSGSGSRVRSRINNRGPPLFLVGDAPPLPSQMVPPERTPRPQASHQEAVNRETETSDVGRATSVSVVVSSAVTKTSVTPVISVTKTLSETVQKTESTGSSTTPPPTSAFTLSDKEASTDFVLHPESLQKTTRQPTKVPETNGTPVSNPDASTTAGMTAELTAASEAAPSAGASEDASTSSVSAGSNPPEVGPTSSDAWTSSLETITASSQDTDSTSEPVKFSFGRKSTISVNEAASSVTYPLTSPSTDQSESDRSSSAASFPTTPVPERRRRPPAVGTLLPARPSLWSMLGNRGPPRSSGALSTLGTDQAVAASSDTFSTLAAEEATESVLAAADRAGLSSDAADAHTDEADVPGAGTEEPKDRTQEAVKQSEKTVEISNRNIPTDRPTRFGRPSVTTSSNRPTRRNWQQLQQQQQQQRQPTPTLAAVVTGRPGLVLDAPPPRPSEGVTTRPEVTAATRRPTGVGQVFDVTLSAVQGYGESEPTTSQPRVPTGQPYVIPVDINELRQPGALITKPNSKDNFVSIDGRRTFFNLDPTQVRKGSYQTVGAGLGFSGAARPRTPGGRVPDLLPRRRPSGDRASVTTRPRGQQQKKSGSAYPGQGRRPSPPSVRIDTCIVGDDRTCKERFHERCRTEGGVSSCVCRPGYGRLRPRTPCKRVVSMVMSVKVDGVDGQRISWDNAFSDSDSEAFQGLAWDARNAINSAMTKTTMKDIYMGNKVTSFYSLGGRLILNTTIALLNTQQTRRRQVKQELQRQMIRVIKANNNYIGDSKLYIEGPLNPIPGVQDLNECVSSSLHDCDEQAECSNVFGGFVCRCRPGLDDRYRADPARSGRHCDSCSDAFCGGHGTCRLSGGRKSCVCRGPYYGERCDIDGEVLGASLGATVAAALVIIITFVGLCKWSKRWHKGHSGNGKMGPGTITAANTFNFMKPPAGGMSVVGEDRRHWGTHLPDRIGHQNIYAVPVTPVLASTVTLDGTVCPSIEYVLAPSAQSRTLPAGGSHPADMRRYSTGRYKRKSQRLEGFSRQSNREMVRAGSERYPSRLASLKKERTIARSSMKLRTSTLRSGPSRRSKSRMSVSYGHADSSEAEPKRVSISEFTSAPDDGSSPLVTPATGAIFERVVREQTSRTIRRSLRHETLPALPRDGRKSAHSSRHRLQNASSSSGSGGSSWERSSWGLADFQRKSLRQSRLLAAAGRQARRWQRRLYDTAPARLSPSQTNHPEPLFAAPQRPHQPESLYGGQPGPPPPESMYLGPPRSLLPLPGHSPHAGTAVGPASLGAGTGGRAAFGAQARRCRTPVSLGERSVASRVSRTPVPCGDRAPPSRGSRTPLPAVSRASRTPVPPASRGSRTPVPLGEIAPTVRSSRTPVPLGERMAASRDCRTPVPLPDYDDDDLEDTRSRASCHPSRPRSRGSVANQSLVYYDIHDFEKRDTVRGGRGGPQSLHGHGGRTSSYFR